MPRYGLATRAQAVVIKALGTPLKVITHVTEISARHIGNLVKKAVENGWRVDWVLLNNHLKNKPGPGRKKTITPNLKQKVINAVTCDCYRRKKSTKMIAREIGLSALSVRIILRKHGFRKTKPTRKPGLTAAIKNERYRFALAHRHWKLEDWKAVIWLDETSIVLGHRRGGYRVWRRPHEACVRSCVRERWKGYSEFMFWGCFTYDFKGPCHIWKPQTKKELDESKSIIKIWNEALEPEAYKAWKEKQDTKRSLHELRYGRRMGGAPAKWKFTASHGAFTRSDGGGVDWWRYLTNILIPKLLPFAQSLTCLNPDTTVQEDKATSYIAKIHQVYFNACEIQRLLWPGNSPDLNMIEPCWSYLKRVTIKRGPLTSRAAAEKAWLGAWQDLKQWRIQQWIERIPRHIKKIIELKGGNDYREGAEEQQRRPK